MIKLAQHYARALVDIKGEDVASKLTGVLKEKGHLMLLPSVLSEYKKLKEEADKEDTARIYVNTKDDLEFFKDDIQKASGKLAFDVKESQIVETPSVVGGFIIEKDGKEIDESYRSKLVELYKSLMSVTVG